MFKKLLSHPVSSGQPLNCIQEEQPLDCIQEEVAEVFGGDGISVGPIGHLSTNVLEEYALGLLVEARRDIVEDHLLVCDVCTRQLEKADSVIAFFKTVLTAITAETSTGVWTCPPN
jgi:hypothetical protein